MGSGSKGAQRRRTRGAHLWWALLTGVVALSACTTPPEVVAVNDQRCMASCNRPSADGQSCLEWSALVSAACVARHTQTTACCGPGDRAMCALSHPLAEGAPCVCRASDARGAFVVQGSACRGP
jgi:hypothetical protein